MAISFKKLKQEEDEDDTELGVSVADKEQVVLGEEKHSPPTKRKFTLPGRTPKPGNGKLRGRLSSWAVAFIAITVFTIAIVISLFIALLLTEPYRPPAPSYSTGAVAADSATCSEMGGEILKAGGSAVDAAIVALLCVGVVHPESSGIGGGGFMTIYDPSSQSVKAINFREKAPAASTVDMYHGNGNLSELGGLAVGVPGEIAGMKLAHDLYGKLPWSDLFYPVIDLARNGYPLNEHSFKSVKRVQDEVINRTRFDEWYYHENGTMKGINETVKRPYYADVLQKIASEGPSGFYKGDIATEIVNAVQRTGGIMTTDDMASYEALLEEPVFIRYNDFDVYSTPLPSGGPQMLFILNVMEDIGLSQESEWRNLTYQHLVESFKYSFAFRSKFGDPNCSDCEAEKLHELQAKVLSEKFAAEINRSISNNSTFPPSHYNASLFVNDSGTTHVSVIDSNGMAVTVTSTVNTFFGSKVITPNGIVLNNEMDDFSSPNITNYFGIPPAEANFISPGKRPQSSACPTIMLKKNSAGDYYAYLAIGAAGGTLIVTSTAQVALEVSAFRKSVSKSVESKRLHHQLIPNTLFYEDGYPHNITEYLRSLGHVSISSLGKSIVQAVAQETEGVLTAHSDSRKGTESGSFVYHT
ncbi:PREDICTED: gamma-glutamyltranspeptidase 1-like [Amphimedon queenslandica]|uniref:Gamma-glutamyltransferase n=1 Tax=Amphimedon queenslandica TaxID=400682 RepID=A0A1X7VBU0_AMPQE|nr:PREDICTED: gamma-glutamyltranspeptidase 1-like [Amphimedon queenslandica]|eukprot:XP_003384848.1 PREDICTED: gamma-glutamyltranspeptidase 1-like [Amphimedon queenslandica]